MKRQLSTKPTKLIW